MLISVRIQEFFFFFAFIESLGASTPYDFGRHIHRYGGDPVGSFFHRTVEPLKEAVAHAVFMDVTHDNPSQFEVKSY